jgi:hypothetical protein
MWVVNQTHPTDMQMTTPAMVDFVFMVGRISEALR